MLCSRNLQFRVFFFSTMICKFRLVLLFSFILGISSSAPATDTTSVLPEDAAATATSTVKDMYEFDDIVESIAAEFVFVVAGDHILLPPPKSEEDLRQLHTDARVLANLITKLHCSQRVHNLLNSTTQQMAVDLWINSDGHNLLSTIFDEVIQRFESDPELYTEFLKERDAVAKQPFDLPHFDDKQLTPKKHTVYEITVDEVIKSEKLLENSRVKSMLIGIHLLKLSEGPIKGPSASRDRIVVAKAAYDMAQNIKTRDQIQKLFDQAVNESLEWFSVMMVGNIDGFLDSLRKKIKDDPLLKGELEEFERNL